MTASAAVARWPDRQRTCSSSRGIITHLFNTLGMLASSARKPLALWAVKELMEAGLKVVLFEVGTRTSPMTFSPTQSSAGLWSASDRSFSVGRLRRHADPVGPTLAENLEMNW